MVSFNVTSDTNILVRKSKTVYTDENNKKVGELSSFIEDNKIKVVIEIDLLDSPLELIQKVQNLEHYLHGSD